MRCDNPLNPESNCVPTGILLVSPAKLGPWDTQELVFCATARDGLDLKFSPGESQLIRLGHRWGTHRSKNGLSRSWVTPRLPGIKRPFKPAFCSRPAMGITQERLAKALLINQAGVSKIESRSDIFVSTLRKAIEAMGGELEIRAKS